MTRWAMVADLRRCVGCQTCTAACKHANATPPGVQWRRVLDMEFGEYPDVQRAFVPVGCQHCDEPPCMDVCPTTATKKRADGIVTIDYDLCIGCAYCASPAPTRRATRPIARASPTASRPRTSSCASTRTGSRWPPSAPSASIASTTAWPRAWCPASTPRPRPACVNACIAEALAFGDIDDPNSNVSQLLAQNQHFRMHEELGTGPGFYYLWDQVDGPDKDKT